MSNSLICINTCNRLSELKKYILPYIAFANETENFDFVLSLDGKQEDYILFCEKLEIPLVFSDQREGVGLSKNRVLQLFPNYDHYFFIDDDVELINNSIFVAHTRLGELSSEFHHLSSTHLFVTVNQEKKYDRIINYGMIGGGYFNYFKKESLQKVGGWHTDFAKYKRYGHTEHSYRYFNIGLSKYPFTIINECVDFVLVHNPEHVTSPIENEENQENEEINGKKATTFSTCDHFELSFQRIQPQFQS
jgi:hypothetical protein